MAEHPDRISTAHKQVFAALRGNAYMLKFPYDQGAVSLVRGLPGAKFQSSEKSWAVNKKWHEKIGSVLDEIATIFIDRDLAAKKVQDTAAERQAEANAAGREALAQMKPFTAGIRIQTGASANEIQIHTAYHPKIVELFRGAGGKYDQLTRMWRLPISAGIMIAAHRDQLRDWHNETVSADNARISERETTRANRIIVLAQDAPPAGQIIRSRGDWWRVESLGKQFRADDTISSIGGPIGHEGEMVRYAYLAEASPEEKAIAERALAEDRAAAEARQKFNAAIATVGRGDLAPDTGQEPDGEVLWIDDSCSATGYTRKIILGADDWLYAVTIDNSDGAAWGPRNAGYNTVARRVPADPDLVAQIRGEPGSEPEATGPEP